MAWFEWLLFFCTGLKTPVPKAHRLYIKMNIMTASQNWGQSVSIAPLVAGGSVGDESCLLHVSSWDMDKTKASKYVKYIFLKDGFLSF